MIRPGSGSDGSKIGVVARRGACQADRSSARVGSWWPQGRGGKCLSQVCGTFIRGLTRGVTVMPYTGLDDPMNFEDGASPKSGTK